MGARGWTSSGWKKRKTKSCCQDSARGPGRQARWAKEKKRREREKKSWDDSLTREAGVVDEARRGVVLFNPRCGRMAAMNSDNFPHFQQLGDFFLPSIPTFLGGSVVSVFLFFFLLFFFFPLAFGFVPACVGLY